MAHMIDFSNGRANMAYAGQKPWHNLGENIENDASLEVWAAAAGLEWEAKISKLISKDGQIEVPGHKLLYRSDTNVPLSIVSERYKPVQPSEVLDFFKNLVEGIDSTYKMETAGSLQGGKKIWGLAKCNNMLQMDDDRLDHYLLLATSFDRSLPTIVQQTSIRVVCWNTLNLSISSKNTKVVRITHNCQFEAAKIKDQLGIKDAWELFAANCMKFADKKVQDPDSKVYFAECMAESNPHRDVNSYLEKNDETMNLLMDIRERAPGQDLASSKGTLWGDLNTVTFFADHMIKSSSQDNRLNSAWFGRGNRVKNFAHKRALELVGTQI